MSEVDLFEIGFLIIVVVVAIGGMLKVIMSEKDNEEK
ncbi:Uncharacterised protein [Campylobacter geochelonis]|uniref:Uncharacterized protein n=1 Tax=Campylobacter geochelonis TaxID=1780362 RepID=A0A128ED91_9BACT|nr:Uncharacterised protein [Campylobacter geochelonis]CZE46362.1 Uncharacterised protein [Campylobacter geochelonis]CZE50659.1 Uncharacterised protein [Campylobacter geochelonis]